MVRREPAHPAQGVETDEGAVPAHLGAGHVGENPPTPLRGLRPLRSRSRIPRPYTGENPPTPLRGLRHERPVEKTKYRFINHGENPPTPLRGLRRIDGEFQQVFGLGGREPAHPAQGVETILVLEDCDGARVLARTRPPRSGG